MREKISNRKLSVLLFFLFQGLCLSTLYGQSIDLKQILEIAKTEYPSIKAKRAAVDASDQESHAAQNLFIPRVSLQHQYTYSTGNSLAGGFYPTSGTLSPSGGVDMPNSFTGTYGSFSSVLMEWDVFGFGKVSSNVKAAKANLSVSERDLENEIFQHQVRVTNAYLQLLMAEKLSEVQEKNEERAKNFYEAVNAAVRSELRAEVDGLLAQAEYERARILLLESQKNENWGRLRLIELLGMDTQPASLQIDTMSFLSVLPKVNTYQLSVVENPVLKLQQARTDAVLQSASAMQKNYFPTVSLVAAGWARGSGLDKTDGSVHTDFSSGTQYQVSNYLLGISARWTITDGFTTRNKYKALKSVAEQNHEVFNQQELMLERQINESQNQYEVMLQQSEAVKLQLNAAQQAYTQANARYANGLTDLPTLLQSMVGLNQAEADLAITYANVWRSLLLLASAQGDLSLFTDTIQ